MTNSARPAPPRVLLSKREEKAIRVFERRLVELSGASLRMIEAAVELRDARAGADAKYKY